ncbi:MAG: Zn-ribbon domain-containing OB-fold protein [Deltaproteobacteria bacterium]|nr:Zn-ribbon domain-containing OB-fold protein [Deltaproteobacteria bacterium]MBW2385460.1 Zn-ribbon domain-containing OB-fold protein [Deltaproteobacteria bacterium]
MAMFEELASINPDIHTRAFWEYCARRELRFQKCGGCGAFRFPPMTGCRECGETEIEWVAVAGRGRVFSYTIVHHAAIPLVVDEVPYAVVVVEFDDAPGARLISNVLDLDPDEVEIGMELDLVWEEPDSGAVLPRFRPA